MAVPEWPELACSGASMASPRITLMPSWTSLGSWTTGGGEVRSAMTYFYPLPKISGCTHLDGEIPVLSPVDCRFVMPARMQVPPNSDLTLGMICVDKSTPGRCTWRMRADERFANPAGIIQGGFLGAFADSAMGAAAVTFVEGRRVYAANAEMKISFLAAVPPGSDLICVAEVVSGGRRVAFVEASILAQPAGEAREADEQLVARATSTYMFRDRD
jgi:uncharacterized protein (TIGR00369 family)